MNWKIIYHRAVEKDLQQIGIPGARRIIQAIDKKLASSPLEFGAPLSGDLAGLRKLRVGDYGVVYQVRDTEVVIYILAVGPRRNKGIYQTTSKKYK